MKMTCHQKMLNFQKWLISENQSLCGEPYRYAEMQVSETILRENPENCK